MVGVRGKVGVLEWFTPTKGYVPANGVNVDHVDYYTFDTHVMVMEPGAEVPIEQVHRPSLSLPGPASGPRACSGGNLTRSRRSPPPTTARRVAGSG